MLTGLAGFRRIADEIDGADVMSAVMHREDAILESWPERDEFAAESFSNAPYPVLEADPAADIDLADNVTWSVFDPR